MVKLHARPFIGWYTKLYKTFTHFIGCYFTPSSPSQQLILRVFTGTIHHSSTQTPPSQHMEGLELAIKGPFLNI